PSASSPPSLLSHQAPSAVQDAAGVLGFSSSRRRANGSRRGSTRTSSAAADARRETVDGDCAVRRRRGLRSTRGSTPTGSSSPIQDGDGRVTGANATKFLAMSGLSLADLKQVSEPSADTSRCHC
uniref:Uncharacterized protein n=1 Tax=Aegilops tauschii subsp. strangulata TaxID=200361 RepID=A0A453FLX3_AEGTS